MKTTVTTNLVFAAALVVMAGCATPQSSELSQARQAYDAMQGDASVSNAASVTLYEARQALDQAAATDDLKAQKHYAYLAQKKIELAKVQDQQAAIDQQVRSLEETQEDFLMTLRQREAETARQEAEQAQEKLRAYQSQEREAELSEARQRAEQAQKELQALRDEMENTQSRQTDSGVVLTLSDVVFEFDKAQLKAGAERGLERLSAFLKQHDQRKVLIEGFTDARGSAAYNMKLSQRRAQSVAQALQADGIASDRITTRGLGEQYPVASNQTDAGRQQNRRVEITILNPGSRSENAGRGSPSS